MKKMVIMNEEGKFSVDIKDMNCYIAAADPEDGFMCEELGLDGIEDWETFETLEELRESEVIKKYIKAIFELGYTCVAVGDNDNGDFEFIIDIIEDGIESYDELLDEIETTLLDIAD